MIMSQFKQATIFAGLLATTITLNAFAFDLQQVQNGEQPYQRVFDSLDKNGNHRLNWSELSADAGIKQSSFNAFDHDQDGSLNYQEFAEMKTHISQSAIQTMVNDSWITAKAKAMLLEEASLKAFKISVETHHGMVLLSGFVSDPALKSRAAAVVVSIDGVKSVKNAIEVKA